jgi:hypothetical protein
MNHYVYYSYEEWGRGYIGVRSCKCNPEEDVKYFGSFYDKTFKPTKKIVIGKFCSRKEAQEAEIILHTFYKVNVNPHFANLARATSSKFVSSAPRSETFKQQVSSRMKGRKLTPDHIKKVSEARSKKLKGKKLSPKHCQKISMALKGKTTGIKRGKRTTKESKEIVLLNVANNLVFKFPSISRAAEATGIKRANIYAMFQHPHYVNKGFRLLADARPSQASVCPVH